jgi:hypothetical protein
MDISSPLLRSIGPFRLFVAAVNGPVHPISAGMKRPGDEGMERDGFLIRQVSVAECAGSLLEKGISGQFARQQS